MNNADSILIIILAVTLTVFLIAAIVTIILAAKLIMSVKRVVERAEDVIEIAGEATETFKNVAGPLALFKLIRNIVKTSAKKHR